MPHEAGALVEARYKGRGTWHRATITRVRSGPVAAETHLAYKQKHELFTGVLFDLIYEDGASGALLLRDLRVRLRMGVGVVNLSCGPCSLAVPRRCQFRVPPTPPDHNAMSVAQV